MAQFRYSLWYKYALTTCPYFDNLIFDILDAGSPQCHFIRSLLRTGRFPRVHWHLGAKLISGLLASAHDVPLALNLPMTLHLRSGKR